MSIRNTYETQKTYNVFFFDAKIHTTVTFDPDTVTQWISDIKSQHSLIVGLDIEWRPSFKRNQYNPAATLQLCVGNHCLIYQLIHSTHIPQSLIEFLDDSDYSFVGVGIKSDLEKLAKDYEIGRFANAVELGKLAASEHDKKELKNLSLKNLSSFVLGKSMEKPKRVTMSRWDNERLTEEQVKYACLDAYVSYEIGTVLMNASE